MVQIECDKLEVAEAAALGTSLAGLCGLDFAHVLAMAGQAAPVRCSR